MLVSADVSCDGSTSAAGFDTLPPPGEVCPITIYAWDIFDGVTHTLLDGPMVDFHCNGPGTVTITLTVTAPDPTPPSDVHYTGVSTKIIHIFQVVPSVGPAIDIYTDKTPGGKDQHFGDFPYPWGWSDAFGPQEQVCVHAKVTYNDEPVEYKPVAFEMVDPTGTGIDFRTVFTDADGIATACFRIPWQGSNAENYFGNWTIRANVDIAEVTVSDIVMFRYGYIVSINSITITLPHLSGIYKGEVMTIDLYMNSISFNSQNVLLTMVVHDNCNVPIGLAWGFFTVDAMDGPTGPAYSITIPTWAFVGSAKLYADAYTDWIFNGGIPFCPEKSATFSILKTP